MTQQRSEAPQLRAKLARSGRVWGWPQQAIFFRLGLQKMCNCGHSCPACRFVRTWILRRFISLWIITICHDSSEINRCTALIPSSISGQNGPKWQRFATDLASSFAPMLKLPASSGPVQDFIVNGLDNAITIYYNMNERNFVHSYACLYPMGVSYEKGYRIDRKPAKAGNI